MRYLIKGMLTACLFYPLSLLAQNEIDALRYSQTGFGSTARSLAMGGAFGAPGADFSSLMINPAGIGVYKKSEFTFSLGFNNRITENDFLENKNSDSKFRVDIPDLGIVFAIPKKNESGIKQLSFALGYNRTANFNSESSFEGKNTNNSILDSFIDQIASDGGATEDDLYDYYAFDADLAYQTYLLDPDPNNVNQYISVIPDGGAYQSKVTTTRGGMGEFTLGFGGNYNEKIFFGVTLGFPSVRYEEESTYEENDKDNEIINADSTIDFKALVYDTYLNTSGNGVNARFGIIFKPVEWVRVGASIHTPTYYYLNDQYRASMRSAFGDGTNYSLDSPEGTYSYNLTTPFKAVGSVAFLFGQNGMVSFDYEFTDYSAAKLDASDYNFSNENKLINKFYNDVASNFRGGLEWKYQNFAFRAGAAYYSTPFKSQYTSDETDQHVISYTGGIGFREKRYYFDLGYGYSTRNEYFAPYTLSNEPVAGSTIKRTDHRIIATMGFRF
ncbi:MAG: hypothetical protein KBH11_13845 [Bacteroidia bacterium]|nr:hypothetical protein [Bacteroidota bacterium]MBK7391403.1 hypothetical protein [Bacteroidota bacterium]MBP9084159.1 hypothetical protein [Bacteroidia bacterium]